LNTRQLHSFSSSPQDLNLERPLRSLTKKTVPNPRTCHHDQPPCLVKLLPVYNLFIATHLQKLCGTSPVPSTALENILVSCTQNNILIPWKSA
jgi:hypothetical protein